MTDNVAIVNRALQTFGSRSTIASLTEISNEVTQANLFLAPSREQIQRMAPWNACTIWDKSTYITSTPGTPENSSPTTQTWVRGQPAPPWIYEYQYPPQCARLLWLVPNLQNNFGGVPLYPAGVISGFQAVLPFGGQAIPFKIGLDFVYGITAATPVAAGAGYAVGDTITLGLGDAGGVLATPGSPPIGAAALLLVTSVSGAGGVLSVSVISQIADEATPIGGSYFRKQTQPILGYKTGQDPTTADTSFNVTYTQTQQRVILTNLQAPTLAFLTFINDPNIMDPQLQEAWVMILGARLCKALSGNTTRANELIKECNAMIEAARTSDGNEGLTVNDVTPDWIRARGIYSVDYFGTGFDWGPLFPLY